MNGGTGTSDVALSRRVMSVPDDRSGRPMRAVATEGGATLYVGDASRGWAGWPLLQVADGERQLWILGELYGACTPSDLLALADGDLGAGRAINGHLLAITWSASKGWRIWTDRFGTVHAYVGADGCVSTSFRTAYKSAATQLDGPAIVGFALCGFYPGERTPGSNVRVLPPASMHPIGGVSSRYWRWQGQVEGNMSFDQAVHSFGEVFDEVISEQVATGDVLVPLSGGLDSRSTLAPIVGPTWAGASPTTFSYGYTPRSVEIEIGERLARQASLQHHAFVIEPYLFDRASVAVAAIEGFQDLTQPRQLGVIDRLASLGTRVIAAHWGDVWLDDAPLDPGESLVAAALRKFEKPGGTLAAGVLRGLADVGSAREQFAAAVAVALERSDGLVADDDDSRLRAVKTEMWSHRWTLASLRAYQVGLYPRLPFYDTRVTDLLMTMPTTHVSGRRLQLEYLRRAAPNLAAVRWQETNANLFSRGERTIAASSKRIATALRYRVRPFPIRNWEVQLLDAKARAGVRNALVGAQSPIAMIGDTKSLHSLLDAFSVRHPTREVGYAVSILLTLSLTLQWLDT